ncbi:PA14 domain-containing protein [Oceanibacterium hippocampi]|uniref:PA14 domain protein n=1 Tax=Oceanibacterium hippocampi TaxID=745714 RepID=A0A1Y5U1K0_9PROT|nr:PA14 domain-containing protein [Oceanibacterium hippocampi]SLN77899.1 PA14 domain protein [Oceanibacterium hippocampi]
MPTLSRALVLAARAAPLAAFLAFAAPAVADGPISGLSPASPQPAASALKPGLAVRYYTYFVRDTREVREYADYSKGEQGTPIPRLDYHVGEGPVLTHKNKDGVGAVIKGLIRMDKPGTYTFMVHSNDGVELVIGGKDIYKDTGVHADRFSDEIKVQVATAGWYPIDIVYFERKNTATLELYWSTPDQPDPDYVPASHFAHLPGE